MPPAAVKTIEDLIYWQYAKIIAQSAKFSKKQFPFIMKKFKELQQGDIYWNEVREYLKEREARDECIFCGMDKQLTLEHLFPRSLSGPNDEKNLVWICKSCNSNKGNKRPYEYFTHLKGLNMAKYEMPRIAEGKYLKFLFEIFSSGNLLDIKIEDIRNNYCQNCDLKKICMQEGSEGVLSPLCLDGLATLCLRNKIY